MSEQLLSARSAETESLRQSVVQAHAVRRWICLLSLVLADVLAFAVAGWLFRHERNVPGILIYQGEFPFAGVVDLFYLLGGFFIVARYVAGDYTRRQLFWDAARLTTIGLLITSIPCILLLAFSGVGYSPYAVIGSWTSVIIAVPAFRQGMRWVLWRAGLWQLSTALIGCGPNIAEAHPAFRKSLSLGFDVRFLVTPDKPDEDALERANVTWISLNSPANIVTRLTSSGCHQAVVATDSPLDTEVDDILDRLLAIGMRVAVIPPLKKLPLLGMTSNFFFGRELLLLHVRDNINRLPSRILKRCVDIIGSLVLLIALLPAFAVITFCIKRADGGPAFFIQSRVGRGKKEFRCIKFRTMRPDAEKMLQHWKEQSAPLYQEYVNSNFKLRSDPRITSVGGWLRRTSLDELPQLVNVLWGDMSLVGPRPLLARELSEYGVALELYQRLRPGITGLWQISGRSHTAFADRIASDEWYIKNWSFWYDLVILIKTVGVLMRRDGAY